MLGEHLHDGFHPSILQATPSAIVYGIPGRGQGLRLRHAPDHYGYHLISGGSSLMVEYIAGIYERSSTRPHYGDWASHTIHPTCCVKQGDPLSPVIFNLVVDPLFSRLPGEIGVRVGNSILNAMGYADDLVLFALSPDSLQQLLDASVTYLQEYSLRVNSSK